MQSNTRIFHTALITICVDDEIAEQIELAAKEMPWAISCAGFDRYISAAKRPLFTHQVRSAETCLVVVDFDKDSEKAIESTRYLQQTLLGKVSVVALSSSNDPELVLLAMRAGCSEFLRKPFDDIAFSETLGRLDLQWSSASERAIPTGTVLSFFGAKGGVGTTTLAVHLAVYLTQCHKKRTLLIDNCPELGHACVYLGVDGTHSQFHEIVRNVSRLDSDLLKGFIVRHSSGLEVLSSPDVCGGMRAMDPDSLGRTLEFLRSEYDYVIVDCATALDENNLAIFENSSKVYLVATPEIGAIRDLSRYVDNLTQTDFPTEKMDVVINRFSSRYAVNIEQIEKAIRLPVAIKLPNCYTELVRAGNLGEPISPNRKTDFSAQFLKWVNTLAGTAGSVKQEARSRSLLALFK